MIFSRAIANRSSIRSELLGGKGKLRRAATFVAPRSMCDLSHADCNYRGYTMRGLGAQKYILNEVYRERRGRASRRDNIPGSNTVLITFPGAQKSPGFHIVRADNLISRCSWSAEARFRGNLAYRKPRKGRRMEGGSLLRECALRGEGDRAKEETRINEGESEEDRKEVPASNSASLPPFFLLPLLSPGSLEMRGQAASDPASG